jgi:hypothetical protein
MVTREIDPSRRWNRGVGILSIALGGALVVWASAGGRSVFLPVHLSLGHSLVEFAQVSLPAAAAVLLVGLGLAQFARPGRIIRWIAYSQVSAITVFLVAQLNGVTEVGALVALYALTVTGALFLALRESTPLSSRRTYGFGSAVAIVPWGIIAFYQIAGLVVGPPVSVTVRLVTLGELACATAFWALAFRPAGGVWRARGPALLELAMAGLLVLAVALPQ